MIRKDVCFVIYHLEVYFKHLHNPDCGSGYPKETSLGRMITGDSGHSDACSIVPLGVEMSDSDYLLLINKVDGALVAVKSYDNANDTMLWNYVFHRYAKQYSIAELMLYFDICKRTCMNWQRAALLMIFNKIN